MTKKAKKFTGPKARDWVAVHAHFRRNGITDRETQDTKGKRDRKKSKVNLAKLKGTI